MATTTRTSKPAPRRAKKPKGREFVSLDGRIRVEDWAKLPETKPHYELIDGILKQKALKTFSQVHASSQFVFALHRQLKSQGWQFFGSGTGFKADNFNGSVPDAVGFDSQTPLDPEVVYEDRAFLIAEILSPNTQRLARGHKARAYAQADVKIYVLIDAKNKTFEVYRLENDKYGAPETLKGDEIWQPAELPGLRLELAQLWM